MVLFFTMVPRKTTLVSPLSTLITRAGNRHQSSSTKEGKRHYSSGTIFIERTPPDKSSAG